MFVGVDLFSIFQRHSVVYTSFMRICLPFILFIRLFVYLKCSPCAEELDINRWDLECYSNNTDHRTDLNGVDRLIVRRGQPFALRLYLRSGNYQPGVRTVHCTAETGANPNSLQ